MNAASLALDEPLSPELVLVLPPELRAQVLARLPAPMWLRPRPPAFAASPSGETVTRELGLILVSRAVQLVQVFVAITILAVAMSIVAHAVR